MAKKEFLDIIANMSPEEHKRTTAEAERKNQKNTKKLNRKRKLRGIKALAKKIGIGEEWYSSSPEEKTTQSHRGSSEAREFREANRAPIPPSPPSPPPPKGFSPYAVDEVALKDAILYYKGTDGEGDKIGCGHEHCDD